MLILMQMRTCTCRLLCHKEACDSSVCYVQYIPDLHVTIVYFQKKSIPTPWNEGHWKFLGGGRLLKAKVLEEMYENKPEFPGRGGGCETKNLVWGEYGYFLELHITYVMGVV